MNESRVKSGERRVDAYFVMMVVGMVVMITGYVWYVSSDAGTITQPIVVNIQSVVTGIGAFAFVFGTSGWVR